MPDLIGSTIAKRYRIISFLGKGGMAEVYKIWDEARSVPLAMKVLHADLAENKVFLRRFKREAQTLAKLQHPNIVRFYGLEQAIPLL
jgi:serine/threonine-protein kinase